MLVQLNSFRRLLLITFSSLFAIWTILSLAFSFKVEATNRKGIQLNFFLEVHYIWIRSQMHPFKKIRTVKFSQNAPKCIISDLFSIIRI